MSEVAFIKSVEKDVVGVMMLYDEDLVKAFSWMKTKSHVLIMSGRKKQ